MKTISYGFTLFLALTPFVSATQAAHTNGIKIRSRVVNDHPSSVLTITSSNRANPGDMLDDVTIDDHFNEGGKGANEHYALLSLDGGATAATLDIRNSFTFQALVNLSGSASSPRKEAGIRLNSTVTQDAQFMVNSDAGEIVAFGGGGPFVLFGSNAKGKGYIPGKPILMGITYTAKTAAKPGTLTYFINRDPDTPDGEESSPALPFVNEEQGPMNFQLVLYARAQSGAAGDYIHAAFTKIRYSPKDVPKAPSR